MGVQVIWVAKEKVPLMVRKSDGGFGYGTTDMAALRQRIHVRPRLSLGFCVQFCNKAHCSSSAPPHRLYHQPLLCMLQGLKFKPT